MGERDEPRQTRLTEHDAALDSLLASLLAEAPNEPDGQSRTAPATNGADHSLEALKAAPVQPLRDPGPAHDEVPVWAGNEFRVLLIRIGEFRFAMPLVLMRSVALLPARWTRVPGQPGWHLGVWRFRDNLVVLADLGRLIGVAAHVAMPRYLLVIGDGGVGLICDTIEDTVLVRRDAVRWRRTDRRQAWLAGTLVEHMCVLLDVDALGALIRHG